MFVDRDAPALDAEDAEEGVVEALRLPLLVAGVGPVAGECGGAGADFGPGKVHDMVCDIAGRG
jgi:hypothetical protein